MVARQIGEAVRIAGKDRRQRRCPLPRGDKAAGVAAARGDEDVIGLVKRRRQETRAVVVVEAAEHRLVRFRYLHLAFEKRAGEGILLGLAPSVRIGLLLDGDFEKAFERFDTVHGMVPGEVAPRLACAATAELILQERQPANVQHWCTVATGFYEAAWRTDHAGVSAAFGLARRLAADGGGG